MLKYSWIYVVAFVLAALRIAGHTSEAYQAVAHMFVAGLFTAAWWQYQETWISDPLQALKKLYLAVALTVVEVLCAMPKLITLFTALFTGSAHT